jgi:hypothetical protein
VPSGWVSLNTIPSTTRSSPSLILGNLKHRNVIGEEVSSQIPQDFSEVNSSTDEEDGMQEMTSRAINTTTSPSPASIGTKRKSNATRSTNAGKRSRHDVSESVSTSQCDTEDENAISIKEEHA